MAAARVVESETLDGLHNGIGPLERQQVAGICVRREPRRYRCRLAARWPASQTSSSSPPATTSAGCACAAAAVAQFSQLVLSSHASHAPVDARIRSAMNVRAEDMSMGQGPPASSSCGCVSRSSAPAMVAIPAGERPPSSQADRGRRRRLEGSQHRRGSHQDDQRVRLPPSRCRRSKFAFE